MIETGVLFNAQSNEVILWHLPPGRSSGLLPDSRDLWEVIWQNRELPLAFAHSHPGEGVPHPSHEDMTTFDAIERALGKSLVWWIISRNDMLPIRRGQDGKFRSQCGTVFTEPILSGCTPHHCASERKLDRCSPEHCHIEWVKKLWKLSYQEVDRHDAEQ